MRRLIALVITLGWFSSALAVPVDFRNFTEESYPVVTNFGGFFPDAEWAVSSDGTSAHQLYNSQPSILYSDFELSDGVITGTAGIGNTADDDQWGFIFGFSPGDSTNASADYLVLDWKQNTQSFNFIGDAPTNATPGATSQRGLRLSRVTGIPSADEFYGRTSFGQNAGGGLTQIAAAQTLGNIGWVEGQSYDFRFEYSSTDLRFFVNNVLQFDLTGSFPIGRFGLYTHSQDAMFAESFSFENNATSVAQPGTLSIAVAGILLLGLSVVRRRCSSALLRPA